MINNNAFDSYATLPSTRPLFMLILHKTFFQRNNNNYQSDLLVSGYVDLLPNRNLHIISHTWVNYKSVSVNAEWGLF